MAIKVLLLRKELSEKQKERAALLEKINGFEAREAELAEDIEAAVTDEERAVVGEAVDAFENERSEAETQLNKLDEDIRQLETDIEAREKASEEARKNNNVPEAQKRGTAPMNIETRTNFFGMTIEQRDAFMAREEVKDFLTRLRDLAKNKRAATGAELGIPEVMLTVLRDNINRYSKLISKVRTISVKGKARQNVVGAIPEGIWTEAIAAVNELDIEFTQVEVDGFKVGGYIALPNSYLDDDSNLALAQTVIDALGQAIGYAADKAIVYGTGSKMPVGIVTRLAAASQPAWWGSKQGAFTNLSATHIQALDIADLEGAEFYGALIEMLGTADPAYSTGDAFWVMNRKTHIALQSKALAFNSAAALVAGVKDTLPIIGGEIVELDFIPDYQIVGGFGSLYLMPEREGTSISTSEHVQFIEDNTVFKGIARYDGKPVRGEAFVAVSLTADAVTTSVEFAGVS